MKIDIQIGMGHALIVKVLRNLRCGCRKVPVAGVARGKCLLKAPSGLQPITPGVTRLLATDQR